MAREDGAGFVGRVTKRTAANQRSVRDARMTKPVRRDDALTLTPEPVRRWCVECDGTESNVHEEEDPREQWCQPCGAKHGHKTQAAALACLIRYLRGQASQLRSVIADRVKLRQILLSNQKKWPSAEECDAYDGATGL